MNINVRGERATSLLALSFVNSQVAKVNEVLLYFGLSGNNVTTSSIYLSPVYSYQNGNSILIGQQASSSMKVRASVKRGQSNIGRLIKSISGVSNTTINGLNFQNVDNT